MALDRVVLGACTPDLFFAPRDGEKIADQPASLGGAT